LARESAPRNTVAPGVRFGKPVIVGTRVPVELVIGKLAAGMTVAEVAVEYNLTEENVRAALGYAVRILASEEVRGSA
jgi:uncharacterized protein (DUF433 family)